jgi:hypothetical protein
MSQKLAFVAPPSLVAPGVVQNTVPDLVRILGLPRREPYDCQRGPDGKFPARTQALIEIETEKFSRGPRISCGCRPRKIVSSRGSLTIWRVLPEGLPPEPPVVCTPIAFMADCNPIVDGDLIRQVAAMKPGESIDVPAVDGEAGHPCITELAPPQAWFLREAAEEGGALGFMGVGSGKSIAYLLAPLLFPDSRLAVLLIEPKQRHHYRSQYVRLREHFRVSSIVSDVAIKGSTVPGTTPVHLISYSVLSQTKNSDMLDDLKPDTLLLDEGHRACGLSAINRRVKRYAASAIKRREEALMRGEQVRARALRLLAGSGTLEVKSINDTQMLSAFALGTGSPVPIDPNESEAWSAVMDNSYMPDRKSGTAKALHKHFGQGYIEEANEMDIAATLMSSPEKTLREGYEAWRAATPGVITSSASDINAAIYLSELPNIPKLPKEVQEALSNVRINWSRPDGEELVEKLEQTACARNVGCGFYPYWAFPKHPCTCPANKTASRSPNWCEQCCLIDDWYAFRKLYSKALRVLNLKGLSQLDSPALCEEAAMRAWALPETEREIFCATCWAGGVEEGWPCTQDKTHQPGWRHETWPNWYGIRDKVEYEKRVKWIGCSCRGQCKGCDVSKNPETHPGYFFARFVANWALKNRAVIWFDSVPLGRKIAELAGLPYFNGGPGGEERLRAEKGDRSIVCSISAHGAGTDGLQNVFDLQVLVEVPPSNATVNGMEQILGRLHRRGQPKDAITTLACLHIYEFRDALRKAIQSAHWNWEMNKRNKPKLLCADIDIDDL